MTILLLSVIAYLGFLATILYAIGFTGGLVVPKALDDGVAGPASAAIAVDLLLLSLFAL
jgi:hypothetical protein